MDKWRSAAVCDVVNLILGVFLFFSPWIFHFAPGAESWNALGGRHRNCCFIDCRLISIR